MHGGARWESTRHTTVHSRLRGAERTLSPSARLAAALRLPGGRPTVMTDRGRALLVVEVPKRAPCPQPLPTRNYATRPHQTEPGCPPA